MRNYKNNFRRNRYKNYSDRNNRRNENGSKIMSDLQNGSNFIRKNAGRNNHNASNLVEKYTNLAREALLNGDKILSENYLQHADHFTRILNERESFKREKFSDNKFNVVENNESSGQDVSKNLAETTSGDETSVENSEKSQLEIN